MSEKSISGMALGVNQDPASNFEEWAKNGLGDPKGIVEAYVSMFSTMLQLGTVGVYPDELHRWLDVYYTLRQAAERHESRRKLREALLKSAEGPGFEQNDEDKAKEAAELICKMTDAIGRVIKESEKGE